MSYLAENLRFLRDMKKLSQEKFAKEIFITRSAYAKYETGGSDPSPETLLRMARFYHISLDILISHDLRKVDLDGLLQLKDNRIVLPMKINNAGESIIEIIPHTAKAGYLTGYSDPEFIENLQHISLPFLRNGKFRGFPIEGDSMPPHKEGSYIIGRYMEKLEELKVGKTYVFVTVNEGIVYKRLYKKGIKTVILSSDNTFYKPYETKISEVLEIWEFACSMATSEMEPDDLSPVNVKDMFIELKREIGQISSKLIL